MHIIKRVVERKRAVRLAELWITEKRRVSHKNRDELRNSSNVVIITDFCFAERREVQVFEQIVPFILFPSTFSCGVHAFGIPRHVYPRNWTSCRVIYRKDFPKKEYFLHFVVDQAKLKLKCTKTVESN